MLRLRTMFCLSALALAAGVTGTAWLSSRSANQPLWFSGTRAQAINASSTARPVRWTAKLAHAHVGTRHHHATNQSHKADGSTQPHRDVQETVMAPMPELVPLSMPVDRDITYEKQRGHLDGLVLMHVTIDAAGHVNAASIAESSGDDVLDAHALRSVREWRFAVPADHASGFSADLPMRFSSHDEPLASTR